MTKDWTLNGRIVQRLLIVDQVGSVPIYVALRELLDNGMVMVVARGRVTFTPRNPALQWWFDAYG